MTGPVWLGPDDDNLAEEERPMQARGLAYAVAWFLLWAGAAVLLYGLGATVCGVLLILGAGGADGVRRGLTVPHR